MPTIDDIPLQHRVKVRQLFTADNYCFATYKTGRTPTFYFAAGGLDCLNTARLCGRLRTMHARRPLVDVTQSPKQHLFFDSKADRDAALDALKHAESQARIEEIVAGCRTRPGDGDYHGEFTRLAHGGRLCSRRHPSGGRIRLSPRLLSNDAALAIVHRILQEKSKVTVDSATVLHVRHHSGPKQRAQDMTTYMAGLA